MTKQCRTLATYTRTSGHYAMVEERSRYLGRADKLAYRLEHNGTPVFHSPVPAPVAGVLVGLMTEDMG